MIGIRKNILLLVLLAFITPIFAQNGNSISLTKRKSFTFDLGKIYKAGLQSELLNDRSQWLNYATEKNSDEPFKSISVSIASGNIPDGIDVYLEADPEQGNGWGKTGKPTGKIKLSEIPTLLVNEIGTCDTGHGNFKGHRLNLTVEISDFSRIIPGDFSIYLAYTFQ